MCKEGRNKGVKNQGEREVECHLETFQNKISFGQSEMRNQLERSNQATGTKNTSALQQQQLRQENVNKTRNRDAGYDCHI